MPFNTELYFNHSKEYDDFVTHYQIEKLKKYIDHNLKLVAIEFGCGTGLFTLQLAKIYDHVLASDISPSQISIAKHKAFLENHSNIKFKIKDFFNYNVNTNINPDLILMAFCLDNLCEHYELGDVFNFNKFNTVLERLDKLLLQDGKVVIIDVMPNINNRHPKNKEFIELRNKQFNLLKKYNFKIEFESIIIKFESFKQIEEKTSLIFQKNRIQYLFNGKNEMKLNTFIAIKTVANTV